MIAMVALPIKTYALFTMNKQGWLTRHAHQIGGDIAAASEGDVDELGARRLLQLHGDDLIFLSRARPAHLEFSGHQGGRHSWSGLHAACCSGWRCSL